jgi:hypothetical protein
MATQTMVMTKKERLAGELEKHDKIQMLLIELRILNRFNNGSQLVGDMIKKKGEELDKLWANGDDKYKYGLTGEEEPK